MNDRAAKALPPHEHAQRVIIGSLALWPEHFHDLTLSTRDFTVPAFRRMYEAIAALWEDGGTPDALSIHDWTSANPGQEIDMLDVADLHQFAKHHGSLQQAAKQLAQHTIDTRVRTTAAMLARSQAHGDALLAEAMTAFNDIERPGEGGSVRLGDALRELMDEAGRLQAGEKGDQIRTGVKAIDSHQLLDRGGVLTIAGRPSMGKSTLAQYLTQLWAEEGERVLVLSTETPRKKLARRFLAAHSRLNSRKITRGDDSMDTWRRMVGSVSKLAELGIWIDDKADRPETIVRSIRRHRQRHGITIVVVDHLQECIDGDDPRREINQLMAALRSVCREEPAIALVDLSQLNRGVENRDDKKPRISDLKESAKIEEVSDAILLMYYPAFYRRYGGIFAEANPGVIEVLVGKNRDGPTGWFRLSFDHTMGQIRGPLAEAE
jgi:replicative DNA helicase